MAKMIHRKDFNRTVSALFNSPAYVDKGANLRSTVEALAFLGRKLKLRYENTCSYEWANTPAYEKATDRLEALARELAASAGLNIYLQGDPRGATIYVDFAEIPANNYSRAFCLSFEGRDR